MKDGGMLGTDRRIGIVGAIVGIFGIGLTTLFPDAKAIGWLSLLIGLLASAFWLIAEVCAKTNVLWIRMAGSVIILSLFVALSFVVFKHSHKPPDALSKVPPHTDILPKKDDQDRPPAPAKGAHYIAEKPQPLTPSSPIYSYENVSMSIGPSLEPQYAFETRFIFSNRTLGTLTDAHYECLILNESTESLKLDHPMTLNAVSGGLIEDLPNNLDRSIYCDFVSDPIANKLEQPILQIIVTYMVGGRGESAGFRFFAKRRPDDKTYVWFPAGAPKIVTVPQETIKQP